MPDDRLGITVVYSPAPREVREWTLDLDAGATVQQALSASGLAAEFPALDLGQVSVGIWGRKTRPGQRLRPGDRIEVYRALRVDPKVARRERFNQQGARAAGLFSKQRPGGKAGY